MKKLLCLALVTLFTLSLIPAASANEGHTKTCCDYQWFDLGCTGRPGNPPIAGKHRYQHKCIKCGDVKETISITCYGGPHPAPV